MSESLIRSGLVVRVIDIKNEAVDTLTLAEAARFARNLEGEATQLRIDAVQAARSAGVTWEEIAEAFEVTRSAAHQRYAHLLDAREDRA